MRILKNVVASPREENLVELIAVKTFQEFLSSVGVPVSFPEDKLTLSTIHDELTTNLKCFQEFQYLTFNGIVTHCIMAVSLHHH